MTFTPKQSNQVSLLIGPPPKIAFDLGNVLVHVDEQKFSYYLDKCSSDGFYKSLDIGTYNAYEAFIAVHDGDYNYTPIYSELMEAWLSVVRPCEPMLKLVEELLDEGYDIALLSNIGIDHAEFIRKSCPVLQRCKQHFSCDVGSRKPQKLYYQSFELEWGWLSNNTPLGKIPFFDDRDENLVFSDLDGVKFDLRDYESDDHAAKAMRALIADIFS